MSERSIQSAAQARSVDELLSCGERARFLFFWGHEARPDASPGAACLSQWWPARFEAEGCSFATAEDYMMWRKALLFGDEAVAEQVLSARGPGQAKDLGRRVRGFDEPTWAAHRWDVVVAGSVAKFRAEPALRDYLVSTERRVLVEASPVDRIWGIGLSARHEDAEVPSLWRGLNLLGFALMEARQRLLDAPD